jgi:gp16 family phage-associated protein
MTPQEVKAKFRAQGMTIAAWAKAHGYTRQDVYFILNGQRKGLWGRGHEIAVALGLKKAAEIQPQVRSNP